ncbi:MAG: argininosuccinate lyase [Gammaproteobacteria bacterium]|nr:argininosuccinate lyase [Gammaproteobacteria bacterium]
MSSDKPWGGRFTAPADRGAETFAGSVDVDRRLFREDIAGSVAHARMLQAIGVLSPAEFQAIEQGLRAIEADIEAGDFEWSVELEDVHMNIEARLTERIGEVGKKLHTARSRNDQVATDVRLFLREGIDGISATLAAVQAAIVNKAEQEADTIMPGFTHLQIAQPVTVGHHLMAWFEMLDRDRARLRECRARVNVSPLGSAALAGTSFPVDREMVARELGFDGVSENSLDAVSDRDFMIEFAGDAALLMVHLSRIAEEIVVWSSTPFGFIDIGDAFCTGSSIMPQKKNPDIAELLRGKAARVSGNLQTLLMLMKAQPLAYNRDNQEDKEPLFDTLDTVSASLEVFLAMVPEIRFDRQRLRQAAVQGFSTATDLADYLVRRKVPFRDAHAIVGRAVRHALDSDCELAQLDLETLRTFSTAIDADVFDVLSVEGSVQARDHVGGTAPQRVRAAIARARTRLAASD